MAGTRLLMRKLRELLRLKWECRLPHRKIALAAGVGIGTVSEYVARASAAGLSWPLPEDLDDAGLERLLFPSTSIDRDARPIPDWVWVHNELKRKHVTLMLLWSEYAQAHPRDHIRYSQFCEHYRHWSTRLEPTMRQVHHGGEKAFVDFSGDGPTLVDPVTGQRQEIELFVGVAGASGLVYAEATMDQQLESWIGAHVRMFETCGGAPEQLIPDNTKTAVTKTCRYEPEVHRSYGEMATHYGAVVIPARSRRPRDKAKVEGAVLLAQRWILACLRNHTCFSLGELNVAIVELTDRMNRKPMRMIGRSRLELFEELDRPKLKPLPSKRYELGDWKFCRVSIDYHIELEHNVYSVPYALIHERVDVRLTAAVIEIFHNGRRVSSHPRLRGRGKASTQPEHMPASHRAHAEWTPSRLIGWAEKSGPATGRMVDQIMRLRPHPEMGFRSCLGLLRLGQKHGAARLEAACERAERLAGFSYKTVKNILGSGLDRVPIVDDGASTALPDHENIRGADYFAPEEGEC